MLLFDHLLVIVFAVIFPITGFIGFRRLLNRAAAGTPIDRNHLYNSTMLNQWILFFALLLIWVNTARPWSSLGFELHLDRWFFIALAMVVIGVLVVWLRRLPATEVRTRLALALILGGAAGNVIDRLVYGYVIDFIDVYYESWHWPAFNIADSAIVVGVIIFVYSLRSLARDGKR